LKDGTINDHFWTNDSDSELMGKSKYMYNTIYMPFMPFMYSLKKYKPTGFFMSKHMQWMAVNPVG